MLLLVEFTELSNIRTHLANKDTGVSVKNETEKEKNGEESEEDWLPCAFCDWTKVLMSLSVACV